MFGFEKVEHKKFKKNFLKTVIIQLSFEKCNLLQGKLKEIEQIFKNDFPRFNSAKGKGFEISLGNEDANFHQIEGSHQIDMRTLDGQKVLTINEEVLSLTISGNIYESFEGLSPEIEKIMSFFSICEILKFKRIAIRKINIVEFKITEDPSSILQLLLNPNLIGNINFIPNKKDVNHYIQSLNYAKEDFFLNIKYGLNIPPQENTGIGQVIIDIDLYKKADIESGEIKTLLETINSEIFYTFNWVISEDTIKLINE